MSRVVFTPNLQGHVNCASRDVVGTTAREVLDTACSDQPKLRKYVLDEQQRLRKDMAIFVNDRLISGRSGLSDPVCRPAKSM